MHELGRPTKDDLVQSDRLGIAVVLDNVRSLQNVGSVFRTCDAFGIVCIHLCGITASPPNREIEKSALGATDTVPWQHWESASEAVIHLRQQGFKVLACEQVVGSATIGDFVVDRDARYAIVFGHEVHGVSQEVLDVCDDYLEVPQVGTKHSLNVAVCAGIVLWEFFSAMRR